MRRWRGWAVTLLSSLLLLSGCQSHTHGVQSTMGSSLQSIEVSVYQDQPNQSQPRLIQQFSPKTANLSRFVNWMGTASRESTTIDPKQVHLIERIKLNYGDEQAIRDSTYSLYLETQDGGHYLKSIDLSTLLQMSNDMQQGDHPYVQMMNLVSNTGWKAVTMMPDPSVPTTLSAHATSGYPAVFAPVMDQLVTSSVPTLLPGFVPLDPQKGQVLGVHLDNLRPGHYAFTLFEHAVGDNRLLLSDCCMLASFDGTTDDPSGQISYWDRAKDEMPHQEQWMLGDTPVTHYYGILYPKMLGGDAIRWEEHGWEVVASGLEHTFDPAIVPSISTTQGIAQYILKNFDFNAPNLQVLHGTIEGLVLGNRPLLEIHWTMDGKTWYSVGGSDWDYIIHVVSDLIPLQPADPSK